MDRNLNTDLPRLPDYIEDAWGLRERPHKGPKRGLSLQRIVEAAISLAAAEGLAAVSMSRIAAELGAATMSLYRYLASKDGLLQLMADAVYNTPTPDLDPAEGWRAGLSRWSWANHVILRENTWALHIPITGPPVMPNQIRWMEHGLECLHGTGLLEGEKLSIMMLIGGFCRNEAMVSAQVEAAFMAAAPDEREAMAAYGLLVRKLADPDRFPRFNAVMEAAAVEELGGPDDEFAFGLERILDGVDALVHRRINR